MKFFLGLTNEETADALGMPVRTVQRKFSDARRWLFEKLEKRATRATESKAGNP
jgi:DNA-directed RNA polymerase specialized sigma24 family protein